MCQCWYNSVYSIAVLLTNDSIVVGIHTFGWGGRSGHNAGQVRMSLLIHSTPKGQGRMDNHCVVVVAASNDQRGVVQQDTI